MTPCKSSCGFVHIVQGVVQFVMFIYSGAKSGPLDLCIWSFTAPFAYVHGIVTAFQQSSRKFMETVLNIVQFVNIWFFDEVSRVR
jgi:hypothetical protein